MKVTRIELQYRQRGAPGARKPMGLSTQAPGAVSAGEASWAAEHMARLSRYRECLIWRHQSCLQTDRLLPSQRGHPPLGLSAV